MFKLLRSKESKNAMWLIAGKVCQMLLSLLVGVFTTRYLGPNNYGIINYASAYVTFFMSFCTLGINSIIIKDFVEHPEDQGKTMGSAMLLRLVSSILSAIIIILFVCIVDRDETITIAVVALSSLSLIFHIFDTLSYWFQYIYQSKINAIAIFIAYFITSIYKIILLILHKEVQWFAFATSVDYIVLAIVLLIMYRKYDGPKFSFSLSKAKQLLSTSYHYILSGMMIAIYGQTDKLMLKHMLDSTEVGYYSTATTVCGLWTFVLNAVIDALYPTILRLYKYDKPGFERKNKQLYAIVFYLSVFVSLIFTFLGELIIIILYGAEYRFSANPLRIITWYTAFSYLGVARNAWIVSEGKQRYLKYMYCTAAILNVGLNYIFIPLWGASGAALASLITQIFTSIVLPMCFKEMRPNAKLMIEAILLKI